MAQKMSLAARVFGIGMLVVAGATAFVYLKNPIDFIPDVTGVLGYVDDAIATFIILRLTVATKRLLEGRRDLFKGSMKEQFTELIKPLQK